MTNDRARQASRSPLLFISHRHDDRDIAELLRKFVTDRSGGRIRVFQSSLGEGRQHPGRPGSAARADGPALGGGCRGPDLQERGGGLVVLHVGVLHQLRANITRRAPMTEPTILAATGFVQLVRGERSRPALDAKFVSTGPVSEKISQHTSWSSHIAWAVQRPKVIAASRPGSSTRPALPRRRRRRDTATTCNRRSRSHALAPFLVRSMAAVVDQRPDAHRCRARLGFAYRFEPVLEEDRCDPLSPTDR